MHKPRKRFAQHFLCDLSVIQQIIAALNPKVEDHLIEIGPGKGALTIPVLKLIKQLQAVELDRDLIPYLTKLAQGLSAQLTLYNADVLTFDFANLKTDARLLRVFGNLPYNISAPLIFHLLNFTDIIGDMIFMLQKEVAERMAAPVNSKHYGRLSVMVQLHCQVNLLFEVSALAFNPPPKVVSTVLQLLPQRKYSDQVNNQQLFASIVKQAFGQRRKTIRNSLKTVISDEVWAVSAINSQLRAENLSIDDYIQLTNVLAKVKTP